MGKTIKENQRGIISLVVIFAVGLFALGAVLSVSTGTLSEMVKNKNTVAASQSFYTAESAMREGAYRVIQEVIATGGDPTYAGGSYFTLNSTLNSNVAVASYNWPYAVLRGTATNGNINRTVLHTITVFPEGFAFDYAVYAEHTLTAGGNATIEGDIFANDAINLSGSTVINGSAYTAGDSSSILGSSHVTNGTETGLDYIPPPGIDFQPYHDTAIAEGTYYAIPATAESILKNKTVNGHIFVVGNTKVQNTNLTGFLYVQGNLQITSGGTFNADGDFAVIVVEGNLSVAGGAHINGIVYVNGSTSFGAGNNIINGALISIGTVNITDVTGNSTIQFDPNAVANWQDLEGLNTTSTEDPRILDWTEE